MREAATISMARVICDTFFADVMRRLISRVLGIIPDSWYLVPGSGHLSNGTGNHEFVS